MRFNNPVTVTVVRSAKDAKGNRLPDSEHDLEQCMVSPRASDESMQRSDAVISGAMLTCTLRDVDLLPTDRIRVPDGHPQAGMWSIVGEFGGVQSAFSTYRPGFRVAMERGT